MQWEILSQLSPKGSILKLLLKNRQITNQKEFLHPRHPKDWSVKELGLSPSAVKKATTRIKKAIAHKEKIIVYGDYDADGVCATAIAWRALWDLGGDVTPFIPERATEGYGLSGEVIKKLKDQDPEIKLIVTVDNGIVANEAVDVANQLGIEVIITDHHQKGKTLPKALAIFHTTQIGGAALAWVLTRELGKPEGLDLAGLGTIADILPLVGASRAFAKHGLVAINQTQRPGLLALMKQGGLTKGQIGAWEVGFILAPRINAAGRLTHAINSLRLLCTQDPLKADTWARELGRVNEQRQRVVEEVVVHARSQVIDGGSGVIILAHESYHEGVIGIAASKLVEEHFRPAIVVAQGRQYSKASARSIPGVNIIEILRQVESLWEEGGGHPMAAGFTIKTENLPEFTQKINELAQPLLTPEILTRKLRIDLAISFKQLTWDLYQELTQLAPFGLGNPTPVFVTHQVEVVDARAVGATQQHLKLTLKEGGKTLPAIAFGQGQLAGKVKPGQIIDVAYNLDADTWRGNQDLQLKIKDLQVH